MKFKNLLVGIIKSWWLPWVLVGAILRLALMPITLHPDLWGHSFSAYFLAYEGKWNLYDTLANLPQSHSLVKNFGVSDIFIYPPLAYYTLGFFRILVKPFTDPTFIPWLMDNLGRAHFHPRLLEHIFLFKLPYLVVDIALAFAISALFEDPRKKKISLILWLFNPLALYTTFMIGQLDILPTFFVVLALYFVKREKPLAALISLGVGGSYKMYPLLFILPAAFVLGDGFKERLKLLVAGFAPFALSILPFLSSPAFRGMVLFSPKSQKMLFMGWPVSGAEMLYPFIIGLFIIYFLAYYLPKKGSLGAHFLAILLLIFSVTHYHPQWFLWLTPLLIWELLENNFKHILITITFLGCWLAITLFFEPSLSYGLFNPIWPQLEKARGFTEVFGRYTDVFQLKSLIRSIFAGASLFLIVRLFPANKSHV